MTIGQEALCLDVLYCDIGICKFRPVLCRPMKQSLSCASQDSVKGRNMALPTRFQSVTIQPEHGFAN